MTVLAALAACAWARPENRNAWKLLMQNKPLEARAEFRKNIKGDAAVAGEAYRGLSVIARFTGDHTAEAEYAFESFLEDKDTAAFMAGTLRRMHFSRQWDGHAMKKAYKVSHGFRKKPSLYTASVVNELAMRLADDGDTEEAGDLENSLGLVRRWWAVGPFSNVSGSGFDKAYPPETAVELGREYEGKNGNRVKWFPVSVEPPAAWLFSQHHLPAANAILYFATQVESPADRKAWLSFGASGSFKVFLNDRLVLADRVFRNTGENAFGQEVVLKKGPNRILVKLGNEDRFSNFQLRFFGEDGKGLADLKPMKPEGAYPKVGGQADRLDRSPTEERSIAYLKARLKADPADEDAAILLMDTYNTNEMTDSGEVWALERLRRHPGSALWQSLLAEALMRSRQQTRSQEYWKAAYRSSPYCMLAWQQEITRLSNSSDAAATLDFIAKSPKEFQDSPQGLFIRLAKLGEQGRKAEAMELFGRIEKLDRFNEEIALFLATVYQSQGRKADAVKVWKRLLKHKRTSSDAYQQLANLHLRAGEAGPAMDALKDGMKHVPMHPDLPLFLGNVLMQLRKFPEAEKAVAAAEALAPTNPVVLRLKGNLQRLAGKKDAARKTLQASLAYNYDDFDSWEALNEMEGKPSFESLAPLPALDSLRAAAKGWEGLKRERGAILAYHEDVFFYPNRAVRRRGFLAIHLETQEAVNRWTTYTIPYNGTYQTLSVNRALTRKAAGGEVDAEVRGDNLVFKSVEPGDAIVMEWVIKDGYEDGMARQAWGRFDFKLGMPAFDSRLRLFMAGRDTIGYRVRGPHVETVSEERDGVRIRSFRRGPYSVSPSDRFLPVTDAAQPDVVYSTFPDWGRIADWYSNLTENKSSAAPILRRLADSLFQGASSAEEKLARVHRFVSGSIAYSSLPFRQSGWVPQSAQEVLASRLGDCKDKSALAKSLLDLAGIPSHLVLVATRDDLGTRPGPIGPYFNHCILAYMLHGRERFMELTDPNLHWTRLPKSGQGSVALVVRRGNDSLIALPADPPAGRHTFREVESVLTDSGDAVIVSRTVRRGLAAGGLRSTYRFLSQDERMSELRKALADDYPDIAVDSAWFDALDPAADSTEYGYRFRARKAVKASGPTRIFSLYLPDRMSSEEVPVEDAYPEGMDLYGMSYSMGSYEQTASLTFPAHWKLVNVPAPVTVKTEYGEYSLTFKLKGNRLSYTRKAVFNLGEPVKAAGARKARGFLTKVAQDDDVQLVFTARK
jgi:tetratricopeptide (TPR) repeat protein